MTMRFEQPKSPTARSEQDPIEVHEVIGGVGVSSFQNDKDATPVRVPLIEEDRTLIRMIADGWRSDPDWEETLASLEKIRRSSQPSPPLEDV
jgi:hypothetical protein